MIESEQRVSWLTKMVKKGLCVNDIEAYISTEHDKLRSGQFKAREEERNILTNLMKLKLKDEKRNLECLHGSRESLRIRLKRYIGVSRKYSSIMSELRKETNARKIELQDKYRRKLEHLETERKRQIEEKRIKDLPEELVEYMSCTIYDKEKFSKLKQNLSCYTS